MEPDDHKKAEEMVTARENLKQRESIIPDSESNRTRDPKLWRDLTSYWVLGLCNNYGYVVMLSAAHDIIKQFGGDHSEEVQVGSSSIRPCNIVSTGAVLLADIVPALFIKFLAPFFPFWVHVRIASAISLAVAGFLLVGFADSEWMALLGVICTSFSSGLGETTFLAYSSFFNKNVVSTWSSGTGGAGIVGSLSYAALRSLHVSPRDTMLIMLIFPFIESLAFWLVLRHPKNTLPFSQQEVQRDSTSEIIKDEEDDVKPLLTVKDKLHYIVVLLKYILPLTTVYLFEYFINQGMFELVYYQNIWLDKDSQYRWLQVDYQIGVFISRSSVNLFTVDKIWIMSALQLVNVFYFAAEVIFYITPNIWIVFAIVFWEGLLGGGAYVNTFYRMSKEVPSVRRQFALGAVALSDSVGIAIAGFLAMPAHNAICELPLPVRPYVF